MRIARRLVPAALLVMGLLPATTTQATGAQSTSTDGGGRASVIDARPRWGPVEPGSWTTYSITAANNGTSDIDGFVVLLAQSDRRPSPPDEIGPGGTGDDDLVMTVGQTEFTGASPERGERSARASGERDAGQPAYRSPITLGAGGGSKSLTINVVEAEFGHRAELRERSGRLLAESAAPEPAAAPTEVADPRSAPRRGWSNVAVMSDEAGTQADLERIVGLWGEGPPQLTTIGSPRDVPATPFGFSGLRALVLGRFDTAGLSQGQVDALTTYVHLGGALVITGGPDGRSRLSSLPDELVPLRPVGTATTDLGPLGDLVGRADLAGTAGPVGVVTGPVAHGRTVLESAGGLPLAVQSQVGAGRVVQLTYDPSSPSMASVPELRDLGWAQGLGRVTAASGLERVAPDEALWRDMVATGAWPAWPRPGVGLLGAYALLCAPLTFMWARRRSRPRLLWLAPAILAMVAVGAVSTADATRRVPGEGTLTLAVTQGGKPALTETYRSIGSNRSSTLALDIAGGAVASTSFAGQNPFAGPAALLVDGSSDSSGLYDHSPGDAELIQSTATGVARLSVQPGTTRAIQILSATPSAAGSLETRLQVERSGPLDQGGVVVRGSVTNRSPNPVEKLRAQLPGGALARLVDRVEPGQTVTVDGRFVAPRRSEQGQGIAAPDDEKLMYAAGDRAFTAADQMALVAMAGSDATHGADDRNSHRTVMIDLLDIHPDAVGFTSGATFLGRGAARAGDALVAYELGGGPDRAVALAYSTYAAAPEVYDWDARTWRRMPDGDRSVGVVDTHPLAAGEVSTHGFVRIRSLGIGGDSGSLRFSGQPA